VALTALVVAGFGLLLGVEPPIAFLVGAVVSSTDAAAVFSVLRGSNVRLKERTGATLEVESGLNDPLAMFLTVIATELTLGTVAGAREIGLLLATQIVFGVAGGVLFGWLGRLLLRSVHLPVAGLYPVLTIAIAFVAFGAPTLAGGSGFLSVYLAGIVLAAGPLPYRAGVRRVHDALAWLLQIMMFLLLGLLVFPSRLVPMMPIGIVLALVLAFVARPLAVGAVLALFRLGRNERIFISWVGLRGAVPIILATYPVLRGVPAGDQVFHLVFFAVLVNSFLPGATVSAVAHWLGLARPTPPAPDASVEVVSLRDFPGEFGWYAVSPVLLVAGARIADLSLPEDCVIALVVRGSEIVTPRGPTILEAGDQLCIFATPASRPFLHLLFGGAAEAET
jgi:cell volume regulation protein A